MIGSVLAGTYRVVRVIGEGGMARLYEAEHLRIDAKFAVKVIHDDLARQPELLTRFEREARAAGRVRSEHVVELVDVLRTDDGRPCLVTELLTGEDLQALLDRVKKLSVAEALAIARQICHAIADAHAVGVVHRDLKPSNVFLCKRGSDERYVKILDFGVAKLEDDERLTRTDAVMGTAAYMAPEQARSANLAGPLADVYSIGAVLYHMLAGEPPYGNVPAISRLALLLHEEPQRPRSFEPSIPEGIEAVIQHAMAREPAARIQSAADLDAQLEAFEDAPPAPAKIATTQPRVSSSHALAVTQRARNARPVALITAVASSLLLGAWITALLAAIVDPDSAGERALIGILALLAIAGLGTLHVRELRKCWSSSPAVQRYTLAPLRATIAAAVAYGALALIAVDAASLGHPHVSEGVRDVLSGLVAGGALWRARIR